MRSLRPDVRADEFVQLQVQRLGVTVLGVLDEENHQEGDDRRTGIDDELPGVREMKERAAGGPDARSTTTRQ